MTASASTNNYNNDAFGEAAKYENPPVNDQASNCNTYSEIQPSSSHAAGQSPTLPTACHVWYFAC